MKKRMLLFLLVVVAVISLVACGNGSEVDETNDTEETKEKDQPNETADTGDEKEDVNLIVSWWGNQVRNENTQNALDLYTSQNPHVVIEGQFSAWDDYWTKLANSSAGGSLPDVIQQDYKYVSQYVENDLLVDLTPYIESGVLDTTNVDQGILESGKVGDGIYAICIGVNVPSLLYNKGVVEEAGVEIKDNMSIEEFVDICNEIYQKTGYKTHMSYGDDYSFLEYYLRTENVVLFEEDRLGVDSADELVPFFELYEAGIEDGWHLDPSVYTEISAGSVEQNPLVYGSAPEIRSWCSFSYSNQVAAFINAAPEGVELGITTWPSDNPANSNYLKPSQFFSVTKHSDNPEEATKIIDFWTNSLEANEILLAERGIPASGKVAEELAPKLSEVENVVIEFINEVVTPNSSTINPPGPEGSTEIGQLINSLVERVCYKETTPEDAAEELFTKGNEILQ